MAARGGIRSTPLGSRFYFCAAAQKMGGLVISLKHEDVAQALVSFAHEYGITHIVLGRPGRKTCLQWFKETLHETILRELPDVDLVIV